MSSYPRDGGQAGSISNVVERCPAYFSDTGGVGPVHLGVQVSGREGREGNGREGRGGEWKGSEVKKREGNGREEKGGERKGNAILEM